MPRTKPRNGWEPHEPDTAKSWRETKWTKDGYELEHRIRSPGDTPFTGWYLYGPNGSPFGEHMDKRIRDAIKEADAYIQKRK